MLYFNFSCWHVISESNNCFYLQYLDALREHERLTGLNLSGTYQGEPHTRPPCCNTPWQLIYVYVNFSYFLFFFIRLTSGQTDWQTKGKSGEVAYVAYVAYGCAYILRFRSAPKFTTPEDLKSSYDLFWLGSKVLMR